ncbi:GLPGLI family protein [Flavobacterium enshiense]|uniref:GLPGLI family protein n=1 Tax=Flavobacterium enshiense TaxID=1341165 RepID=UPI00345D195C
MKKLFLFFLIVSFSLKAQKSNDELFTVVTYKMVKADFNISEENTGRKELKEMAEDMFKAYDKVECELLYNKEKSLFRKIDKIEMDGDKAYRMASVFVNGNFIRDNKKNEKIKQTKIDDVTYNVIYPSKEYDWELINESKKISGYTCYKAKTSYDVVNRTKNTTTKVEVIAWYSPEIPCNYGPRGFDGLPGLVLEVQPNKTFYFHATNIAFNIKRKDANFDRPLKGEYVTKQKCDSISNEQFRKREEFRKSLMR